MSPNDADGIANSVDTDQPAPFRLQSDLGLHCLPRYICPKTEDYYGYACLYRLCVTDFQQ